MLGVSSVVRKKVPSSTKPPVLGRVAVALVLATVAWGQSTEKVLVKSLIGGNGGLSFGPQGNLYGTENKLTRFGGVYQLHSYPKGTWGLKVLYRFAGSDGASPQPNPVFDTAGNLYGSTTNGGANNDGTIYQLTPTASGFWTEKVLYNFQFGADGENPNPVIIDSRGNLYGTTFYGGLPGFHGTIFELSNNSDGTWSYKVLYRFTGGADGGNPQGALVRDSTGNLYGTTFDGGSTGHGTTFQLSPESNGDWTFHVVRSFCMWQHCTDGTPGSGFASVTLDNNGNLYGMTAYGGHVPCDFASYGCGTVFRLVHTKTGAWNFQLLHSFCSVPGCVDGEVPGGGVVLDGAGRVYGTTLVGGAKGHGTLFRVSHAPGTPWIEDVLYSFCSATNCADGDGPLGNLLLDNEGNLFGTTPSLGFEVTP